MKVKHTPLLQGGLILLIVGFAFLYFENQKVFQHTDYSGRFADNKTKELSLFETNDGWKGNVTYDSERAVEGKTSMTLSSWYGAETTATLQKTIPLNGYTKGYLLVFVKDTEELRKIIKLNLELHGGPNENTTVAIENKLQPGWNRIAFIVPRWKQIEGASFVITSAPGTIAEVNIDRIWIENTDAYIKELIAVKPNWLALRTIGERTYLYSFSPTEERYLLSSPTFVRSGTVTVSLIPERGQYVAFGMNGTRIEINGSDMKTCRILADDKPVIRNTFKNTAAANDYYVFLRAQIKGSVIGYSLSNNGVDFETCGETKTTKKERAYLLLNGSFLIDGIEAEYVK